eukprot:gnl/Spiro4/9591_TR5086_c0_g2_i1.p1 gnl/Spiro4/9591_TR5086_c0_g2~~gnl/Spiro4/9591_TR5086_c0_g2_i1.p1  ORF type:complete len:299 (+),score=32.80 gnl/Spiro4/9591_TR5086_c0_g2_i1:81-977(+)
MGCTDTKGATDSTTSSATGDKPKPQPPTYTPVVVPAFNSVAVACPPAPALTTSSTSTSSAPPIAPAPKSVSIPSQPSRPVPQSAAHVLPRTSGATPARAPVYQRLENLPHLSNSSLSAISTAAREAAAAMSATLAAVDTPTAVLARYGAVTVFRNNQGTEKTGTRILADGVVQLFQDMGFDLLGEKDPSLLVLFIMFRLNVGRAARWIKLEPFQALLARVHSIVRKTFSNSTSLFFSAFLFLPNGKSECAFPLPRLSYEYLSNGFDLALFSSSFCWREGCRMKRIRSSSFRLTSGRAR